MSVRGKKKNRPGLERRGADEAYFRAARPLADGEKPDQLADKAREGEDRQEALLDEAIEETFPGSDPISPKHITSGRRRS
jgi:hypothetical protein